MRSPDEMRAYAAFLLSEKNRHLKDIDLIDKKLAILARKGYPATQEGDWISFEELDTLP